MSLSPLIFDRATLEGATHLLATFGESAEIEAAIRASRSRDLGNVHHFCHWRQVERVVAWLAAPTDGGTVH